MVSNSAPPPRIMSRDEPLNRKLLIAAGLVLLTIVAYWGINRNRFVSYDDDVYVVNNDNVQRGLSLENIAWAFKSTSAANWHPLTWISHMADCQLFGLNPAGHHIDSLLIHCANVVLLFWVAHIMTGALWRSAFVAALFAAHPINVESVAWVAERKNLLSTLFWLLAIGAYVRYARRPAWTRYTLVVACFALALMSKPMAVTLPFTLLLLDYWPLARLRASSAENVPVKKDKAKKSEKQGGGLAPYPKRSVTQLITEKAPLLAMAIAAGLVTVYAQRAGGAVATIEKFPILHRFENAVASYLAYLLSAVWPTGLAVFYPYPRQGVPAWQLGLASVVVVAITGLAIRRLKQSKYLAVGWFWYVGTLAPVIGLVQVGLQARADRYAYVPFIGLFVAAVWVASEWAGGRPARRQALVVAGAIIVIVLAIATRIQIGYWQNSITLFEHALAVTDKNYVAHNNLGELLAQQGKLDEAAVHFATAIEVDPSYAHARHNMGMVLVQQGKLDSAIAEFEKAIEIEPRFTDAYNKLGAALANQGRLDEAIADFSKAVEIDPTYASAYANLGSAYDQQGKTAEAIAAYSRALELKIDNSLAAQTHFKLGKLLARAGNKSEAIAHYREALRLKPDYAPAQQALRNTLAEVGR
jgi:protein O-mannosyl-transferase